MPEETSILLTFPSMLPVRLQKSSDTSLLTDISKVTEFKYIMWTRTYPGQSSNREKRRNREKEREREREECVRGSSSMQTLLRGETVHSPKLVDTVAFQTVIKSE